MRNPEFARQLDLQFERLEQRRLLAGQVNMIVNSAGDLILNGDAQNNDVEISMQGSLGSWVGVVNGRNGTMIRYNGNTDSQQTFELTNRPFDVEGIRTTIGDVRVSLKGGDDVLEINPWETAVHSINLNVGGHLNVNLGSGDDHFDYRGTGGWQIEVDDVPIFDPDNSVAGATVLGGSGNDEIYLSRLMFSDRVRINTGSALSQTGGQGDFVTIQNSRMMESRNEIRGGANRSSILVSGLLVDTNARLDLLGGSGEDRINVSHVVNRGDTRLDLGPGGPNNSGQDRIELGSASIEGDLDIRGGAGSQRTVIRSDINIGMRVMGETDISLGGGEDELIVTNDGLDVFLSNFYVRMGAGKDGVNIRGKNLFQEQLNIQMGGANDLLWFEYYPDSDGFLQPVVLGSVIVNGGGGFDELFEPESLVIPDDVDATRMSFEYVGEPVGP